MAEEPKEEKQEKKPKKKTTFKGMLMMIAIMVIVPAILALVAWFFVIAPIFSDEAPTDSPVTPVEELPDGFAMVDFDQKMATVLTEEDDEDRMLMYQVSMAVTDEETATLINSSIQLFESILVRAHNNHSLSQLNDTNVQAKILKQVMFDANALLKKLAPEAEGRVHKVFYRDYNSVAI